MHCQQFVLIGVQPREQAVEGDKAGASAEGSIELRHHARMAERLVVDGVVVGHARYLPWPAGKFIADTFPAKVFFLGAMKPPLRPAAAGPGCIR